MALAQAELIRQGRWAEVDGENVAEEIEGLGKSLHSTLQSNLARLLQHLLKWDYQPERRTRSWETSIKAHRLNVARVLRQNQGLRGALDEAVADAYATAVLFAASETGLLEHEFPERCPYAFDEIMDRQVSSTDH